MMHRSTDGVIYLNDLDRCRPQSGLSPHRKPNAWKVWSYETADFSGMMLVVGEETKTPDVTYPLDLEGWYALYVGMYARTGRRSAQVRLSNDPTFSTVVHEARCAWESRAAEIFWKVADLTGQEIVFQRGNRGEEAFIPYVKLVPLSQEELASIQAERESRHSKRLFAHHDLSGLYYSADSMSEDEIRGFVESYRHTDFDRLYYEFAMGDVCAYFSKIGRTWASATTDSHGATAGHIRARENWKTLKDKGIDPPKVAVDTVRQMRLQFHAAYRLNMGFMDMPPLEEMSLDGLFYSHPQWRCHDRDGKDLGRMSYAFPQVRRFVISLLAEIASYDIDGICLLLNRQPPHVMYEAPLVQGFKQEYGLDPRALDELDELDERWLRYRCCALTEFMRQVRAAMEEVGQSKGKRIEISAWVMGSEHENLFYGVDLKVWLEEGLVDTLIADNSVTKSGGRWNMDDVAWLVGLTNDSGCELAMSVMPRIQPPEEFCRYALELYRAGVRSLAFWDTDSRRQLSTHWTALRRLGHVAELEAWQKDGEPSLAPSEKVITRLGDYNTAARERLSMMTDYTPTTRSGST